MKVLYFMNHVDHGGAALALYDLIFELRKCFPNYTPIVINGQNNNLNQMFTKIGVENYSANFKNFLSTYKPPKILTYPALTLRYDIGKQLGLRQIEKIIDFKNIDIIHSNLDRIDIGAILAAKYEIPHVWHIRENTNIEGFEGDCSKKRGTCDFDLISVKQKPIEYINSFDKKLLTGNHFVAISDYVRNEWIRKGIPKDKIHLIYDGIRTELYEKADCPHNYFGKRIPMIFLGGYCREKGQELLLQALTLLSDDELKRLHIDFFGEGDKRYFEYIKKKYFLLQKRDVIRFNSYDYDIASKLGNYVIGFNCSNEEGFGRVTVEYMMAGLCPVVSNAGANSEIVTNEKNGLIFDRGNVYDLRDKLQYIVNNLDKIKEYGNNARVHAKDSFTMRKHALEIMQFYYSLIG